MNDLHGDAPDRNGQVEPEDVEVMLVSGTPSESGRTFRIGPFEVGREDAKAEAATVAASTADILDAAREHLRRNELDDALALAMDAAREHPESPDSIAAKMIIARVFINRKEYRKAQAILQAVPERETRSEVLYYLGLCRSRIGDVPGAVEALRTSLESSPDESLRERAEALLRHVLSGEAVCPECGRKTGCGDMTEVGEQTLCNACAAALSGGTAGRAVSGKAGVRPAVSGGVLSTMLRRAAFVPFLAALAYLSLYVLSVVMPDTYTAIRPRFPAAWTFLPETGLSTHSTANSTELLDVQFSVVIDSPSIDHAIVGVPVFRRLTVGGKTVSGGVDVRFSPEPQGRYRMDERTGQFSWTPGEGDAGREFGVAFIAAADSDGGSAGQSNVVRVYSAPRFRSLYQPGALEADVVSHLLAADFSGDGASEIVMVQGRYHNSRITVLQETADGYFHPMGGTDFPGRPAGAGVVEADGRLLLCVADYWNGVIRYYSIRTGEVTELPFSTPTPGKPILASVDRVSGVIAALCRSEKEMRLVVWRAVSDAHVEKIGDWDVPAGGEHVWRRVLALPELNEAGARPGILLLGGDPSTSLLLFTPDRSGPVRIEADISGTLVDAVVGNNGRVQCLLEEGGEYSLAGFSIDASGRPGGVSRLPVGEKPFLNGMTRASLFGKGADADGNADVALLSATRFGCVLADRDGAGSFSWWPLPSSSRLLGASMALPGRQGRGDRVLYLDAEGTLWSAGFGGETGR